MSVILSVWARPTELCIQRERHREREREGVEREREREREREERENAQEAKKVDSQAAQTSAKERSRGEE